MGVKYKQLGFTIVELLIVIVVIAVLAAITVVAYNGVQQRARASVASSAASQGGRKLELYKAENGSYPLTGALASAGVSDAGSTSYDYTSDGSTYCLTASVETTSYKTSGGAPTSGGCAGHSQGGVAAITNAFRNPSAEVSLTTYSNPNGSTIAQSSARARSGSQSVLMTLPSIGGTSSGINLSTGYTIGTHVKASTVYSLSAWVYVPTGTVNVGLSTQGAGVGTIGPSGGSATTGTKDAWARINCTFTTAASGQIALYVLNSVASTAGMQFYVDSVMLTEGSTLYNYGDGDTTNWTWTGASHVTTSTGPAP